MELTAAHPVVEMYNAVTPNIADLINNPMKESYNAGVSWVSTRESIRSMVESELKDANAKLQKLT